MPSEIDLWRDFHGPNAGYLLELYERFRQDPDSVDAATRALFERWSPPVDGRPAAADRADVDQIVGTVNLAQSIREYGHLAAQLDPLGGDPPGDPALAPDFHGVDETALRELPASLVGGPIAARAETAQEALKRLREVYAATIGYDYDHVRNPDERAWLREAAETRRFHPENDPINERGLLDRLTEVEVFERFLHRIFPGKTRFSIEGLDVLVPILDVITASAAEADIHNILIGMAHRGRLNVIAHVLCIPYAQILARFRDPLEGRQFRDDLGWTGDVKYHLGALRAAEEGDAANLTVKMAPNPSHLEAINPVVVGMARAAGTRVDRPGAPRFDHHVTLPVLIHGDAGFPGQGIVAETLNLSQLKGYRTGGSIHIIANNQLGYTTPPSEGRSTLYASDLAKGFKIPIVHVNADDPEACIEVARLAMAYRERFQKDFLIDLIGYRRYGHNEGDEPSFTQPQMYDQIESHPTVRERWARTLEARERVDPEHPETLVREHMETLQQVLESLEPEREIREPPLETPPPGAARKVQTAVPEEQLAALNQALLQLPEGFEPHRKIERARSRRQEELEEMGSAQIDWATAEELAFASILADGVAIRLTGEDTERGTFSQRHAVFHDVETGEQYIPLQNIPQAEAAFEVRNSPLSEAAALAFEYGYNAQEPVRLVLWEAQYGDFINNAQTVVDEFLSSARAKWGETPSLVLLLPHGLEGAGPDHSSGRLERFLQLAAQTNMRVANPTTAAQYFHLLRRQAALLDTDPLPLIVMTPKSLLRHPRVSSPAEALSQGAWLPVIDDPDAGEAPEQVERLVLCSGKVYVDLVTDERREEHPEVAIVRLEQLYPFPVDRLTEVISAYPEIDEVLWVQEEPENMGAWTFVRPRLERVIGEELPLRYVGRPRNASPAEGSAAWFQANQQALIAQAFAPREETEAEDEVVTIKSEKV